jgi:hypothetical protein
MYYQGIAHIMSQKYFLYRFKFEFIPLFKFQLKIII